MSLKTWATGGAVIGSIIGGFIPALWGNQDLFSLTGVFWSTVGGLVGIWIGWKAYSYYA